jgi:hypothetical protein
MSAQLAATSIRVFHPRPRPPQTIRAHNFVAFGTTPTKAGFVTAIVVRPNGWPIRGLLLQGPPDSANWAFRFTGVDNGSCTLVVTHSQSKPPIAVVPFQVRVRPPTYDIPIYYPLASDSPVCCCPFWAYGATDVANVYGQLDGGAQANCAVDQNGDWQLQFDRVTGGQHTLIVYDAGNSGQQSAPSTFQVIGCDQRKKRAVRKKPAKNKETP